MVRYTIEHLSHLCFCFFLFFEESLTKCESSSGRLLFLETGVRNDRWDVVTLLLTDDNLIVINTNKSDTLKNFMRCYKGIPFYQFVG